jgi:hypothetical protein
MPSSASHLESSKLVYAAWLGALPNRGFQARVERAWLDEIDRAPILQEKVWLDEIKD